MKEVALIKNADGDEIFFGKTGANVKDTAMNIISQMKMASTLQ